MEKKDFPKGTKPREIFVYTCERIAEPLRFTDCPEKQKNDGKTISARLSV